MRRADISTFLERRRSDWDRLESLLALVESRGLRNLSPAQAREFGQLYRRASSDLVTARSRTANAEILQYLNDLVARSYSHVYRAPRPGIRRIGDYLFIHFPRAVRTHHRPIALAALLFFGAAIMGWEMNRRDPTGAFYVLPPHFVRQFPGIRQTWSRATGHPFEPIEMPILSSVIMTHNIGLGLVAFAGGILAGAGPVYAMVQNGLMLGILGQEMSDPETALTFWSLILPHGFVEIAAILIMGGAGFMLAGAVLLPGRYSVRDALIVRGREALVLAVGGGLMLVVAGIIEGFITPPAFIPRWVKLIFSLITVVVMALYFLRGGRGALEGE